MKTSNGKKSVADVVQVSVRSLKPSPENSILYRERTKNDSDFARFVESVRRANKVKAPLLVSKDYFIISGHQRPWHMGNSLQASTA